MARLAIIGAGAKAAAIAARAAVWRSLSSRDVPELLIFEKDHVGAAWSGGGRYSSGFMELCTPGEKDVGFPYSELLPSPGASAPISPALFSRFSFSSFLVASGAYSEWVDRGRPHPSHKRFAAYLKWVFEVANQPVVTAIVDAVVPLPPKRWRIEYTENGVERSAEVDGVILTGAGPPIPIPISSGVDPEQIYDAENFWSRRREVIDLPSGSTVAVAGGGGAAGAIIAWLAEALAETEVFIKSVSPMGTFFPRGDGYSERRLFNDPEEWGRLSEGDRKKLLERTEDGVVSAQNKEVIDRATNVGYVCGKVMRVHPDGDDLSLEVVYDSQSSSLPATRFISAIGFDPWEALRVVRHPPFSRVSGTGADQDLQREIEQGLLEDLSMPGTGGLSGGLHLPSLSGVKYGPGLGNLNSLGTMAAKILDPYLG